MSAFTDLVELVRVGPDARWTAEDLVMIALDKHAHELAERIRSGVPRGYCPCANLIDPEENR